MAVHSIRQRFAVLILNLSRFRHGRKWHPVQCGTGAAAVRPINIRGRAAPEELAPKEPRAVASLWMWKGKWMSVRVLQRRGKMLSEQW
ncbi:hypothetical protein B0T13DRAFT_479561 [Neurospora crassa]|nr:hypothetical protein B0T13DRAFT_479561 [Neurospora crassa]